jgi:hypothetical protein
MGLDINNYSSSYHTLHELRKFALNIEGNTDPLMCNESMSFKKSPCGQCVYCKLTGKLSIEERSSVTRFYAFIDHSDCEYGYISFSYFNIKEQNPDAVGEWDDLDELKREVEELNQHKNMLEGYLLEAWEAFYQDVTEAEHILEFH